MRCPKGAKVVYYERCVRELFATYGECARWDGLVEKVTVYEDDACVVPLEVSAAPCAWPAGPPLADWW